MLPLQSGGPGLPVLATLGAFVVVGGVAVAFGLVSLRTYLLVRGRETTAAGDVGTAPVALSGTVRAADETLDAPLTGEPCVAYHAEVDQYYQESDGGDWRTISVRRDRVPFVLADETGEVGVDPADADVSLGVAYTESLAPSEEPPEHLRAFVEDADSAGGGALRVGPVEFDAADDRFRFVERRLAVGADTYVAGTADGSTAVAGVTPSITGDGDGGFLGSNAGNSFVVADGAPEDAAGRQLRRALAYVGVGGSLAGLCGYLLGSML